MAAQYGIAVDPLGADEGAVLHASLGLGGLVEGGGGGVVPDGLGCCGGGGSEGSGGAGDEGGTGDEHAGAAQWVVVCNVHGVYAVIFSP